MAKRQLTDWLKSYIDYTKYMEAPDHYHLWAGIAAIAGALQRKCYIDQAYFRWSPNFYIILVGPSGVVTKSTAMHSSMDLLKEVSSIFFGPNTMTWQALLPELNRAQIEVSDSNGDFETQSCLTFASSEFGTLLDPSDGGMLNILVDLWDGKTDAFRKLTVGMGEELAINPWLHIFACTTPTWIAANMPRSIIGGGFTSRCVFVYADRKRRLVAYPKKLAKELEGLEHFWKLKASLIHDLEMMAQISGEYELTPEAEVLGEAWYEDMYYNPPRVLMLESFDGYLSRRQGHVHKLAMVLAAAETDELKITESHLTKAIQFMGAIENDMPKVFQNIRTDNSTVRTDDLLKILEVHKVLPRMHFYRLVFMKLKMPKKEFDEVVESAMSAGVMKNVEGGKLAVVEPEEQGEEDDRQ